MQVIQIGAAAGEIWRNIDFSKWRLPTLNTVSGFVFVDVAAFRRSKSISKPNFFYMSICGWNITISVLEKQTSAILEFYFRFHFRPFHCNRRVIVHQPAEFRPKRTTHCGNTTSYQFFKMAAAAAQITSGFVSVDVTVLRKVKIYQQTKFCQCISIHGSDITTSGLENELPPYCNSTSGFDLKHFTVWHNIIKTP